MLGLLVALALGVVIGLARGGSFKRLESVRLRALPILFGAVALQVAAAVAGDKADRWIALGFVLLAFGFVFVFAVANRSEIGMPLVALGSFSNLLAITLNRGMPVSLDAARRVGLGNPFDGSGSGLIKGAHRALTDDTKLRFLTDIIPLRLGGTVISVGDLLIWAGLLLLLQHLMVGPRGRHRANA